MSHVAWSVWLSVCPCIGHTGELCENGLADRDAVWGPSNFATLYFINRVYFLPRKWAVLRGGMCRLIVTCLCVNAFLIVRLLPRANVPAKHTWRTNAFAAARGEKTRRRCGLLPNYFGHVTSLSLTEGKLQLTKRKISHVNLVIWWRNERLGSRAYDVSSSCVGWRSTRSDDVKGQLRQVIEYWLCLADGSLLTHQQWQRTITTTTTTSYYLLATTTTTTTTTSSIVNWLTMFFFRAGCRLADKRLSCRRETARRPKLFEHCLC